MPAVVRHIKNKETRNAWNNLQYSPLGIVMSRQKIPQTPFLNIEVTVPMFTKFLHNIAQLS